MQFSLFNLPALPPVLSTWERVVTIPALGSKGAIHAHRPSGMTVTHCGHPTANFPYYILTPAGEQILAPNGRGFQRLALAKSHVEQLWKERT